MNIEIHGIALVIHIVQTTQHAHRPVGRLATVHVAVHFKSKQEIGHVVVRETLGGQIDPVAFRSLHVPACHDKQTVLVFHQIVIQRSIRIPAQRLPEALGIRTALGDILLYLGRKIRVMRRLELLRPGMSLGERHLTVDPQVVHNRIFQR